MATYFMHKNKCVLIKRHTIILSIGQVIMLRTREEPEVDKYFIVEDTIPFFNAKTEDAPSERVYLKQINKPEQIDKTKEEN